MTTLKQGDLIKNGMGMKCKVLEVCGEVVLVSPAHNHSYYGETCTESQLKDLGYTWDTPAWEPANRSTYWYINESGDVDISTWNDDKVDHARRDFLGIHRSRELCEAALLEIRRKLGK